MKLHHKTDKGKISDQKYINSPKFKITTAAYRATAEAKRIKYATRLVRDYGLSWGSFETMLISQLGKCKSCEKQMSGQNEPHVDHNHITNLVRGLLCGGCNLAIGHLSDSPTKARQLADYLELYEK